MTATSPRDAPPATRRRFAYFDSLRGIAATAVMVFHVAATSNAIDDSLSGRVAVLVGPLAVSTFFALSGFLLYRPYLAARAAGRPGPGLRPYAIRRVARIVPAFWVALTVLAIFPGIVGVFSEDFWVYYGFLQVYSEKIGYGIPVAWTLCVEATFYVLLPLWALAMRRAGVRAELLALGSVAVVGTLFQVLAIQHDVDRAWGDAITGQCVYLALGMALAVWSVAAEGREPGLVVRRPGLCWAVAGVAFAALVADTEGKTISEIAAALAVPADAAPLIRRVVLTIVIVAALVLPAVFGEREGGLPRRILALPAVAYIGLISLSFYLYHLTIAELLWHDEDPSHFSASGLGLDGDLGPAPTPVLFALTFVATLAVGSLSYRLVERPFMTLARRAR